MKFQGQIPGAVTFFLGALILWDVLFRSQQGITISFLEEIWARNLMNLFASPLKPSEFLAATMAMSILKVIAVSIVMAVAALVFYSYNVFMIWISLVPFVLNTTVPGRPDATSYTPHGWSPGFNTRSACATNAACWCVWGSECKSLGSSAIRDIGAAHPANLRLAWPVTSVVIPPSRGTLASRMQQNE